MTRRLRARDYRVAIPSYQRAAGLAEKTLPTLLDGGVPPDRVRVYLHDNDPQLDDYRAVADQTGIELRPTTQRGITNQRTHIISDYPPGTPLVSIDDDVTAVEEARDQKTLRRVTDLDDLFRTMFVETAGRDLYLWGLAPVVNPFYLRPGRLSEGLKFLIFSLYGCYTRPGHPVHQFTVPYKDEHETSLRAWWYDGAALRHDGMAARANFYTDPGGCQAGPTRRTPELVADSVNSLRRQWPGLVRLNTRKNDTGYTEITLTPKKRGPARPTTTPPPGDHPRRTA